MINSKSEIQWPEEFLKRMRNRFGKQFDDFIYSLNSEPPVSIRLNPSKSAGSFPHEEAIPWSINGRYLSSRPSFTMDPLFHAGTYYVQESSSQFLEQVFKSISFDTEHPTVLDLCAAPGGKSTHLLSLLQGKGVLISNEVIATRNSILKENIAKWGLSNSIITRNEPAAFGALSNVFDLIVVDAPCSGEGLFRRDPYAANEWSADGVQMCSIRQQQILKDVLPALKSGGWLIYSTCTYESQENEGQIRFLSEMGMELVSLKSSFHGIEEVEGGLAFYPHRIRGEGFFISLFRKREAQPILQSRKRFKKSTKIAASALSDFIDLDDFDAVLSDTKIWLHNERVASFYQAFCDHLYIRSAGIYCGDLAKDGLIPSAELALSIHLKGDIPGFDLELNDALSFLRGESSLNLGHGSGWKLMRYGQFGLGWIKQVSGRFNNYYPKEWRIRRK